MYKPTLNHQQTMYLLFLVVSANSPESNAIPRQTPNALMQRTLSKEAAAMTRVGIPLFIP